MSVRAYILWIAQFFLICGIATAIGFPPRDGAILIGVVVLTGGCIICAITKTPTASERKRSDPSQTPPSRKDTQ